MQFIKYIQRHYRIKESTSQYRPLKPYKSLNDAEFHFDGLTKGQTEIWYMKKEHFRDMSMGPNFLLKYKDDANIAPLPTPKTIDKTHILLGRIKEKDLEEIYTILQGDNWSPGGEARDLIRGLGLAHTSMTVGDIIGVNGKYYMVDSSGFYKL